MNEDSKAQLEQMDMAADAARQEIANNKELQAAAALVGAWMKKNYMKAGYKRLAKVLIEQAR